MVPWFFQNPPVLLLPPVAPHNLNVRPIIVPDDNIISFEIEGRTDHFICALDSRKELVDKKVQLAVPANPLP